MSLSVQSNSKRCIAAPLYMLYSISQHCLSRQPGPGTCCTAAATGGVPPAGSCKHFLLIPVGNANLSSNMLIPSSKSSSSPKYAQHSTSPPRPAWPGFLSSLASCPAWLPVRPGLLCGLASCPAWLPVPSGFMSGLASCPAWLHVRPGFLSGPAS